MKRFFLLSVIAVSILFGFRNIDAQTPTVSCTAPVHTSNGYVKSQAAGLTFVCGAGATCTVGGVTIAASTTLQFPIPSQARTGNDIPYTVTGGNLWTIECR